MLSPILNDRRRRRGTSLAAAACILMVLSGFLPSPVICFRAGQAPQSEFFTASCSCRQERALHCPGHGDGFTACPDAACTDIALGFQALPSPATDWPRMAGAGLRPGPAALEIPALPPADPASGARSRGAPRGRFRSPASALPAGGPLRC